MLLCDHDIRICIDKRLCMYMEWEMDARLGACEMEYLYIYIDDLL